MSYKIGDRVIVTGVAGKEVAPGIIGADPHPEHLEKHGTITSERSFGRISSPVITLDDGDEVGGWECWWRFEEKAMLPS